MNQAASPAPAAPPVLRAAGVSKHFTRGKRQIQALGDISLDLEPGSVNGLLGPDGAGKTTFMRLCAGLLPPTRGRITVLGRDSVHEARAIQAALGYMPQRFGLYEDLSVQENLDLYADLQGVPPKERSERYPELMELTNLAPFTRRLAGRLSGGMKQKLGLACALIKTPELLLLDEPTVGVDPLSRRELWAIVDRLVKNRGITVLLSTAYLDEAERCDRVFILLEGRMLGQGAPSEFIRKAEGCSWRARPPADTVEDLRRLQTRLLVRPEVADATLDAGAVRLVLREGQRPEALLLEGESAAPTPPCFEDGFMLLLQEQEQEPATAAPPALAQGNGDQPRGSKGETIIAVEGLERRFGSFYAVRDLSFTVGRGEIFGLLGPNGAGKSTTFRMLCGLLPASGGRLEVAGQDLRRAAAKARRTVGYMAQKFSLYGQLSVRDNLNFFSGVYGLRGKRQAERIRWALEELELAEEATAPAGELPFGFKQRLALACALMHEPEILFLDEPTSGVDPLARRRFWERINALALEGVTVVVTTHFMEEAEYCDRMLIIMDGELVALGTPDAVRALAPQDGQTPATIERAFIALVEERRRRGRERG